MESSKSCEQLWSTHSGQLCADFSCVDIDQHRCTQVNVVLLLFLRVSQVLLDQLDLQGHQDYRYVTSNSLLISRELHSPSGVTFVLPDTQLGPSGLTLYEDADGKGGCPAEPIINT